MTTITISGIVHLSAHQYSNREPLYVLYSTDMSEYGHAPLGEAAFDFELPFGWSPNSARISLLERQREKIGMEFNKRVVEINQQINNLLAIECGVVS